MAQDTGGGRAPNNQANPRATYLDGNSAFIGQSITLRRLGDPPPFHPEGNNEHVQAFLGFWYGFSDTVTLPGVEVIQTRADLSDSSTGMGSGRPQEDIMDIDANSQINTTQADSFLAAPGISDTPTVPTLGDGLPSWDWTPQRRRHPRARQSASPLLPDLPPLPDLMTPPHQRTDDPGSYPLSSSTFIPPELLPNNPEGTRSCGACLEALQSPIFLTCGHVYCRLCLNKLVSAGVANRMSWPPRCCGSRKAMDVEAIQIHLDEDVLIRYVSVVEEYSTPNPVYCSNKVCSRHIERSRVKSIPGKFVQCGECDTLTCIECKQGQDQHMTDDACKSLEELMNHEDRLLARRRRWTQCPGCQNLVEKTEGCDHMQCQCGTEFCYKCGARREPPSIACLCSGRLPANAEGIGRRHMTRRVRATPALARAPASNNPPTITPADTTEAGPGHRPLLSRVPPRPPHLRLDTSTQSTGRNTTEDPQGRPVTIDARHENQSNENTSQLRAMFHPPVAVDSVIDPVTSTQTTHKHRTTSSRPVFRPPGGSSPIYNPAERTSMQSPATKTPPSTFSPPFLRSSPRLRDSGSVTPTKPYATQLSSRRSHPYAYPSPGPMGFAGVGIDNGRITNMRDGSGGSDLLGPHQSLDAALRDWRERRLRPRKGNGQRERDF